VSSRKRSLIVLFVIAAVSMSPPAASFAQAPDFARAQSLSLLWRLPIRDRAEILEILRETPRGFEGPGVAKGLLDLLAAEEDHIASSVDTSANRLPPPDSEVVFATYLMSLVDACRVHCDAHDPRFLPTMALGLSLDPDQPYADTLLTDHGSEVLTTYLRAAASPSSQFEPFDLLARIAERSRGLTARQRAQIDSTLMTCVAVCDVRRMGASALAIGHLASHGPPMDSERRDRFRRALGVASDSPSSDVRQVAAQALTAICVAADTVVVKRIAGRARDSTDVREGKAMVDRLRKCRR
jgi:hypothetical protein